MKIEDKAYFDGGYFRTAATPLSLLTKDLRETLRRFAAIVNCPIKGFGNLTTQNEFTSKINQLKTWISADIAKMENDKLKETFPAMAIHRHHWIKDRKEVIAELKKIEDTKISLLPTVAKNAMPVEDKAYFAKSKMDDFTKNHLKTYIENRYRGKDKQKIYSAMLKVWEDNPEYWSNEGWASVEKAAGFSMPVEDKAYFDRRIYHSTGTFHTLLDKETRVQIDGTSKWVTVDPAQYITPRRVRISGIKGEIEIAAQLSGDEIKGISAKTVKATAARQGSKAKFDKEWTEAGYTATNFFIMLERAMKSYEGQHDYEYRDKIIGLAKTLMQHPDFKVNGQSTRALAKKAFALVKFKYARQGVKTKFYLDPSNISLILKRVDSENRQNLQIVKQKQATNKKSDLMDAANLAHGMAYSNEYANHLNDLQKISQSKNPAHKQAAKEAISKIEAIESFWQKKYSDLQSQYRAAHSRTGSKAKFAATRIWPNDYSEILNANAKYARLIFDRQKIIRANAGRRIKGEQPLEVPAPPTAPEFPFAFADGDYVGLVLGGQSNVPKGATVKWAHNANSIKMSRTGTKTKFANRGAFAEASSSPVLGSLLEKKVMPEGGWRAVETDGGALVIAFEDNDIAGNFARRAAENGYSATAPMAMAGRFWNVKVQNENKN